MSLKGDALAKFAPGALGMVAEFTANIQPENEVAQFIDENISILSKTKEDDESDVAHGLLQKLSVAEANNDPEFSLSKLLAFYEQFRVFYVDYQSPSDLSISKEAGDGEDKDTTKDTYMPPTNKAYLIQNDGDGDQVECIGGTGDTGYVPPLNIDLTKDDATDSE